MFKVHCEHKVHKPDGRSKMSLTSVCHSMYSLYSSLGTSPNHELCYHEGITVQELAWRRLVEYNNEVALFRANTRLMVGLAKDYF
jgi:hypothetical protein